MGAKQFAGSRCNHIDEWKSNSIRWSEIDSRGSNYYVYHFFYDFVPAIGLSVYTNAGGGEITLSDCTLNLYAHKEGGKEPENWVTLNNGTVTPDVDGALKVAAWDTEVSLSNNVKVKKLKQRPEPPAWAQ